MQWPPSRLTDMRAQCRAAPKEERLSTLRILSKLVFLLNTRAVVERCKVRGSTLGMFVLCVVPRMTLCVICRPSCPLCTLRNKVFLLEKTLPGGMVPLTVK